MDFIVLIIGSDINAYYMARCYYEKYHKKAYLLGKEVQSFTAYSNILNVVGYYEDLWENDGFLKTVHQFAIAHPHQKKLLIASNDHYVRLMIENQEVLKKDYIFGSYSTDLLNSFLQKEEFYQRYQNSGLPLPQTVIYDCIKKGEVPDTFAYPMILKPGDGILYHKHDFVGASKVFKIKSYQELQEKIERIIASGYPGKLILQEFIPGEDSDLYDSIFYVDRHHQVKLVTFAQIGLQEHTQTGVGNCTVLVNGFAEKGNPEAMIEKMTKFLESTDYVGFAEFDLKYDSRTDEYKVFEINPRQARSSYYLTACGHNLVEYLVRDLIEEEELPKTILRDKMVLSFVPKSVIKKYVTSEPLKREIFALIKEGKWTRPLHCRLDKNLKRRLWLWLRDRRYEQKYKKMEW